MGKIRSRIRWVTDITNRERNFLKPIAIIGPTANNDLLKNEIRNDKKEALLLIPPCGLCCYGSSLKTRSTHSGTLTGHQLNKRLMPVKNETTINTESNNTIAETAKATMAKLLPVFFSLPISRAFLSIKMDNTASTIAGIRV